MRMLKSGKIVSVLWEKFLINSLNIIWSVNISSLYITVCCIFWKYFTTMLNKLTLPNLPKFNVPNFKLEISIFGCRCRQINAISHIVPSHVTCIWITACDKKMVEILQLVEFYVKHIDGSQQEGEEDADVAVGAQAADVAILYAVVAVFIICADCRVFTVLNAWNRLVMICSWESQDCYHHWMASGFCFFPKMGTKQ